VRRGFVEFLKVEWHPRIDKPTISGFSHDVFLVVLDALPFHLHYEFVPFMNKDRNNAGTYNELLYQIKLQVCFYFLFCFSCDKNLYQLISVVI
jgi:ionotropic glutamate receptor